MVIIDTSVWIDLFRDSTGKKRNLIQKWVNPEDVCLTGFNQLELLQGCRNEQEWALLGEYLEGQEFLDPSRYTWADSARIFFDLRRMGRTVRSPIDCCIAQIAMDHKCMLLHRDRDFTTIAEIRPLQQQWVKW